MENTNYSLFVAVSTGQGVSNLPPILQYAKHGDVVLWLISPEAEANGWAETSIELLQKTYNIDNYGCKVKDLYAPKFISDPVVEFVKKLEVPPAQVFFVLNGGPKLTPLGLFGAGNELAGGGMKVHYLHGSDKPCMLRVYDSLRADAGPPKIDIYKSKRMLPLSGIAQLNNVVLKGGGFDWQYGMDYLYEFDFDDMALFYLGVERRKGQQGQDRVGPNFEKMVFERVVRFFQQRCEYKSILKEVKGKVGLLNDQNRIIAELDVAITLLNGTVLSLECKSGASSIKKKEAKDLNSRIFELRRASSRVGRMWVVVPYFPESSLFKKQEERVKALETIGFRCLCFTPPGKYFDEKPCSFEVGLEKVLKEYLPEVNNE